MQVSGRGLAGALRGEVLDLSLGGMRFRLPEATPALQPRERLQVSFCLADEEPFEVEAEVVYRQQEPVDCRGVRFLPLAEPSVSEARERRLWQFLLDEQRRARRLRYELPLQSPPERARRAE